nr:GPP34 family phosphoprotein [Kibdelosporangium sp. MJ126-NF4]CEL19914.1 hypothetical protein [Kibdelosporangium sp. MJ126-NF4]CTQ97138.1 hypothetical protein [Kibdelosporangium sp. MJ126-NF4]
MLTAHDLLLLMLDDETGKIHGLSHADIALAGALLVDLDMHGLVELTGGQDSGKSGRLVVRSAPQPAEPVLRHGLEVVRDYQGRKPGAVLRPLSHGLRDQLAEDLVHAGILRYEEREKRTAVGLFRTTGLPANDDSHEAELRARLWQVFTGEADPDWRTGPLIGLLHAMDAATKVIFFPDRNAAKQVAQEIFYYTWVPEVVRTTIAASAMAGG